MLRVEFEEEEDGTAGTKEKQQIYTIPGFTAPASTKVKNKGNVEGYVFIEVRVPVIKKDEVVLEKGVKVKGKPHDRMGLEKGSDHDDGGCRKQR